MLPAPQSCQAAGAAPPSVLDLAWLPAALPVWQTHVEFLAPPRSPWQHGRSESVEGSAFCLMRLSLPLQQVSSFDKRGY